MLDLNKIMNDSLAKIEEEKFLEQTFKKHIEKCIDDVIGDLFKWNGPLKKQLEEVVQNEIKLNLKDLDVASYSQLISNIVANKLDEAIHIQGAEKVKAEMDKMLKKCKETYTLSEIVDELKKEAKGFRDDYEINEDEKVALYIDKRYSLIFIKFDVEEDVSEYRCKYSLTLRAEDNSIHSVEVAGESQEKKMKLGIQDYLTGLLFSMYANGAKVELDEGTDSDDYDLYLKEEF